MIHERLTYLTFPSYWHYTVLRGLDYLRDRPEIGDPRLEDPIALLVSRRRSNGRWPLEQRIPGVTFLDMGKPGGRAGGIRCERSGYYTPDRRKLRDYDGCPRLGIGVAIGINAKIT